MFRFARRAGRPRKTSPRAEDLSIRVEPLEPRILLDATVVSPIPDATIDRDAAPISLDPLASLNDPDLSGTMTSWTSSLGQFFVELFDDITPLSVANFRMYLDAQAWNDPVQGDTFVHRTATSGIDIVQGGGFRWDGAAPNELTDLAPVPNEFDLVRAAFGPGVPVNREGTIAYAKTGSASFFNQSGGENSATNQWFFNVTDNAGLDEGNNGGFTPFGQVAGDGLQVLQDILALPIGFNPPELNAGLNFSPTSTPLQNFTPGDPLTTANLVMFTDISVVPEMSFQVTNNTAPGIVDASFSNGSLVLTPQPGQAGISSITVRGTDLFGNFVDDTFDVTVSDGGNESPTVDDPLADAVVPEEAADVVLDLDKAFDDPNGDTLTYEIIRNTHPRAASTSIAGSDLTIGYPLDGNGIADITVRATDPGGAYVEDEFRITVTEVNDDPVVFDPVGATPFVFPEDTALGGVNGLLIFTDPDIFTNFDTLDFSASTDAPDILTATVAPGTDSVDLGEVPHAVGDVVVTVRATDDDGAFAEDSFTITFTPENDIPTVDNPAGQLDMLEDDPDAMLTLSDIFGDVDLDNEGDTLTFSVEGNDNTDLVTASVDGDELTLSLQPDMNGTAVITLRATDLVGESVDDTLTVVVAADNDPVVADDDERTTIIGQPVDITVLDNDSDIDGTIDPTTVTILDLPDDGDVEVDPVTGVVTYDPDPGFAGTDTFTYTVMNTDPAPQTSNEATVEVTVQPGDSEGVAEGRNRVEFAAGAVTAMLKLAGEGQAEIFNLGDDQFSIVVTGPTDKTTVTLTSKGGVVDLLNFTADGSMKAFTAKTTNLVGNGNINIAGTIGAITMNNVAEQHFINVGPQDDDRDTVTFKFKSVTDTSIISLTPIKSLTVTEWLDTDDDDTITTPHLGKLASKGDRKLAIAGHFQADLELDGSLAPKQTLGSVKIAGDLTDVTWDITGDVGSVSTGNMTNVDINVASRVKSVKAKIVEDSNFNFDNAGKLTAYSWMDVNVTSNVLKGLDAKGARDVPGDAIRLVLDILGTFDPKVKLDLGNVKIKRALTDSDVNVTGDAGTVSADTMTDVVVEVSGAFAGAKTKSDMTDVDFTADTIKSTSSGGDIIDSIITATAPFTERGKGLDKVSAKGVIDGTRIQTDASNVNSVKAAAFLDSQLYVGGVVLDGGDLPDDIGDFPTLASLKSASFNSSKQPVNFRNSFIAALEINKINVGKTDLGIRSGASADRIKSFSGADLAGDRLNLRNLDDQAALDALLLAQGADIGLVEIVMV